MTNTSQENLSFARKVFNRWRQFVDGLDASPEIIEGIKKVSIQTPEHCFTLSPLGWYRHFSDLQRFTPYTFEQFMDYLFAVDEHEETNLSEADMIAGAFNKSGIREMLIKVEENRDAMAQRSEMFRCTTELIKQGYPVSIAVAKAKEVNRLLSVKGEKAPVSIAIGLGLNSLFDELDKMFNMDIPKGKSAE